MASREVIVLVGGTSSLAKALVDQYLLKDDIFKIIITARSIEKFDNLYSSYPQENIDFYELDVLNLIDIEKLVSHLNKYEKTVSIHYLAAIKNINSIDIENLFKINFLSSVFLYDLLLKNINSFNFILLGSQGDIHGTVNSSSYNASKAAMSNYFEPIALRNRGSQKVFIVKPWLFKSKIVKSSSAINVLTFSAKYVAKELLKGVSKDKPIIYAPSISYKIIELLSFISKRLLYFLLFKFMKS